MKVLLVNTYCGFGSTGRICTDIANELKKKGHIAKVAYGAEKPMHINPSDTIKIGNKKDWFVHTVKTKLTDSQCLHSKHATKEFIKEIDAFNPDIIHLHNIHGNYLNMEILFDYLSKKSIPVIWTLHDCWLFTGHCAYFTIANCDKWKIQCENCPQEKEYPRCYGLDKSARNYNLKKKLFNSVEDMILVTPSNWLKNLVKQSFLKGKETLVIHNGIDISKFNKSSNAEIEKTKEKYGLLDKKIVLGVTLGWNDNKGLKDFRKLATLLPEEYQIVLVGVKEEMMSEFNESNITPIHRTNDINELKDLYSCAEVYVNPTHQDNYPTVNLEAIACGCPIIAYNVGGNIESAFLDESESVDEYDVEKICNKIVTHDYKVKEIDQYIYSKEYMVNQYIDLYESRIKNK